VVTLAVAIPFEFTNPAPLKIASLTSHMIASTCFFNRWATSWTGLRCFSNYLQTLLGFSLCFQCIFSKTAVGLRIWCHVWCLVITIPTVIFLETIATKYQPTPSSCPATQNSTNIIFRKYTATAASSWTEYATTSQNNVFSSKSLIFFIHFIARNSKMVYLFYEGIVTTICRQYKGIKRQ